MRFFDEILFGEMMRRAAEVAGQFRAAVLLDELIQLLAAQGDERLFHLVAAAIALVKHRLPFQDFHFQPVEPALRQVLQRHVGHFPADGGEEHGAEFQLLQQLFTAAWHGLHQHAARAQAVPLMHQAAQRHQGGLLLGHSEILGKVLAQLAGHQLALADVGTVSRP